MTTTFHVTIHAEPRTRVIPLLPEATLPDLIARYIPVGTTPRQATLAMEVQHSIYDGAIVTLVHRNPKVPAVIISRNCPPNLAPTPRPSFTIRDNKRKKGIIGN